MMPRHTNRPNRDTHKTLFLKKADCLQTGGGFVHRGQAPWMHRAGSEGPPEAERRHGAQHDIVKEEKKKDKRQGHAAGGHGNE